MSYGLLSSLPGPARTKLFTLAFAVLPSFVRNRLQLSVRAPRLISSTAYLDGIRGLAAIGVVILHMVLGFFSNSSDAYNGEPGRDYFFQLPFVRLLYTGQPTIFFIIGGYVLSLGMLRKARAQAWGPLQLDLSSKLFRRIPRLYIPAIIATFIPMVMVGLGLFPSVVRFDETAPHHTFDMAPREPTLWRQFVLWCGTIPPLFWPFTWENYSQNSPYAYQLWTIVVEFRCSMVLVLVNAALARASIRTRLWLNGLLSLYLL